MHLVQGGEHLDPEAAVGWESMQKRASREAVQLKVFGNENLQCALVFGPSSALQGLE